MVYRRRAYTSETDYAQMRSLVTRSLVVNGPRALRQTSGKKSKQPDPWRLSGPVYCTVGNLDWWRCTSGEDGQVNLAQLWVDEQENVCGIAWPSNRDEIDLVSHPRHWSLEAEMIRWAEERRTALLEKDGATEGTLRAWAAEEDDVRSSVLLRRGFERTEEHFALRLRPLDGTVPEAQLPPGYRIRQIRGVAELDQRVRIHHDSFGSGRMTVRGHLAIMRAPTYRPDLDLVAVAPDGNFAAFCLVWFDPVNLVGLFEPVGCHPAYRRRGLARALLYEGMRRLQALGARAALAESWHANALATNLYEAVGLRIVGRNYAWVKHLSLACAQATAVADD